MAKIKGFFQVDTWYSLCILIVLFESVQRDCLGVLLKVRPILGYGAISVSQISRFPQSADWFGFVVVITSREPIAYRRLDFSRVSNRGMFL